MKALILAGGFGIRLKEIIHDRPKVMAPINGRPFLEYVLGTLRKNGVDEIVVSIGYLGDFIRNYFGEGKEFGLKIFYSEEEAPLGTAGAVKKAENFFDEPFLVINGDTYLETDLEKAISFHQKKKALATIVLTKRKFVSETGLVIKEKSGKITSFIEKPEKERGGLVNSGHYILEPQVLRFIAKDKRVSLEKEIFPLLAKRGVLYGFEVNQDFIDVGDPQSYKKVQELLSKRKREIIEARAPVRISFAGGGTDLPSYSQKEGGYVVSATIDMFAHVRIKAEDASFIKIKLADYQKEETYPLGKILPYDGGIFDLYKAVINRLEPNEGMEITVWGDFPAGSGLGSSSAITVALIGAILKLKNQEVSKEKVARLAIEIEREILKIPGGWQDQYAASLGGINFIEFLAKGKVIVKPLNLSRKIVKNLEERLLLFFLTAKRSEKLQQEQLTKGIKEKEKTKETLGELKKLAREIRQVLEAGEVFEFGNLLHQAWLAKRKSGERITTSLVDRMYQQARENGAIGGKLLGAGGGGCLLICTPLNKKERTIKALTKEGARLLPFKFEFEGLKVEAYED